MGKLAGILARRNPVLCVLSESHSVFQAAALLAERELGALLIVDAEGRLTGIFSERDLLRRVIALGRSLKDTRLAEVMTPDPVTATPEDDRRTAISKMRAAGCRHLPVIVSGQVMDMLSMRDLLFVELEEKQSEVVQLRAYISGSY